MKEEILRNIVTMVCDGYVDTIMTAIEENIADDFPITIACSNFLAELREKNIKLELVGTFEDSIFDRIFREFSNYLAR